ncbi:NACHT domain-containing protein [Alkalinema pantanalense CENA528]|uniref:NACHT domain-containing protein n=1 Tax=Alkalinema pantanalense TaxID=1620705 RepID=UPI003D6F68E2
MADNRQFTQRTLQLSIQGGHQADQALLIYGTKTDLAVNLAMSRTTVTNFFARRKVDRAKFKRICRELKLKWEEVIESSPEIDPSQSIDLLVQQLRDAIRPLIQDYCGMMRVLDMQQPIELTGASGIYTNVNILGKLSRLRSERELPDHDNFNTQLERSMLAQVTEKRVPGLQVVEQYQRLMVLGKPGAGKTTFLKYLAIQCMKGRLSGDRVPLFVTLKDFADTPSLPSLVKFLANFSIFQEIIGTLTSIEMVEKLLITGRALVLLDGLDEVQEKDTPRVIREIRDAADQFGASQFVITCRLAAKEYTFERFTEVEIADFDNEQIMTFVENWFRAKDDLPKASRFMQKLAESQPIRELASSPLLLTLLCLVFGEEGDFPSRRADLYEEGVRILLKKWDAKRNIQRDEIYKKLDVQRREDLLSYVAFQTFKQNEYFIQKRRVEGYIADFIRNLRDVDPDPEMLQIDSELVLRAIQAQHGLLVEQARGIYSFSHLTFQEYFAAREIVATNRIDLLLPYVNEKRWREVLLLTLGMLRSADTLLLSIKKLFDLMLAQDDKLQRFLQWVYEKSSSVAIPYKAAAVRAFYYDLARARTLDLDLDLDLTRTLDLDLALAIALTRALARARILTLDLTNTLDLDLDLSIALARARTHASHARTLTLDLALARTCTCDRLEEGPLKIQLQKLRDRLPSPSDETYFKKWWQIYGQQWIEDLREIMIVHRNLGYDWQFTPEERQLLRQYYDANLLLVQCLNSDCYVSRAVRLEIEETVLLPISEINQRKQSGQHDDGMDEQ